MNLTSLGDMAQSLMLRNRSAQIKQTIATLTEELSTGRTTDIAARVGGDFSYLADIDRSLTRLQGFSIAAAEASAFSAAAQIGLGFMHDQMTALSGTLISAGSATLEPARDSITTQARAALDSAITKLNGTSGGRSLFAGTATDQTPLEGADVLLSSLKTVLSGLTTSAAITQATQDWFDDPAGFRAVMYRGSDSALAPVQIGPGQHVSLSFQADNPEFRDVLRNTALASLATDGDLALTPSVQNEILAAAGEGLIAAQDQIAGLSADIGFAQARIEEASTRNGSARVGLEYAKGALLEADPFETAIRLEDVQFQLESLYSVTVRNSRLSLLSFMK